MILDGTDTFETRYTLNDAAVAAGIPVVHASVFRFEGQLTVFKPFEGPCYRCLYPTPPPPELAPGCSVAGVLGVVPGIMGLLQATEALKVLLGIGDRSPAGCSSTTRSTARSRSSSCGATRTARPAPTRREAAREAGTPLPVARSAACTLAVRAGRRSAPRRRSAARDDRGRSPRSCARTRAARSEVEVDGRDRRRGARRPRRAVPGLADQLLTADGELNRFVNVYVNGQDVRYLSGRGDAGRTTRDAVLLPARRWPAASTMATAARPRTSHARRSRRPLRVDRRCHRAHAAGRDPADVAPTRTSGSTPSSRSRTRPARSRTASAKYLDRGPRAPRPPRPGLDHPRADDAATPASRSR